jgi:hypothetical protein
VNLLKQMKELPTDLAQVTCAHLVELLWDELGKPALHERQHVEYDSLALVYKKRLHGVSIIANEVSSGWITHQQHDGDSIVTTLLIKCVVILIVIALYPSQESSEQRLAQAACAHCMERIPALLTSNSSSISTKIETFSYLFTSFSDLQLLRDDDDDAYSTEHTIELFMSLLRLFDFSHYLSIDKVLTHVTTQVRLLMMKSYDTVDSYAMSKEVYSCWNELINVCLENRLYNHIVTILVVDVPVKCLQLYPNSVLPFLDAANCSSHVMLQLFRHHLSILMGFMDQVVEEIELDDESDSLIVDDTTLLLLLLDPTLNLAAIRETKVFQYLMHFIVNINRVRESSRNAEASALAASGGVHTLDTYITKILRFKLPFLMSNIAVIMRLIHDDLLLEGAELYGATHLDSRYDGYDYDEIIEYVQHAVYRPMNIPYTYLEAKSEASGWEEYANYCKATYKKLIDM